MKDQKRTGTRLFLIEFLIVLFFFFLVSAVCLKLFAAAHQTTAQAEARSYAQTLVSSALELLEARSDSLDSGQIMHYFDASFASCSEEEASYILTIVTEAVVSSDELPPSALSVTASVTKTDRTLIYTLSTTLHRPLRYEDLE